LKTVSFIPPGLKHLENTFADVLVLFRFTDLKPLAEVPSLVDWRLRGHLSNLIINGFITGTKGEKLLMPLGRQLPQEYLLLVGLGETINFNKDVFCQSIDIMFETIESLNKGNLVLALPGRSENVCETINAIEWFLECRDNQGGDNDQIMIETPGAQKAMLPVVERWRLKQLIP
jgi:Cytosol aminopeptidase family, N-terminal domain